VVQENNLKTIIEYILKYKLNRGQLGIVGQHERKVGQVDAEAHSRRGCPAPELAVCQERLAPRGCALTPRWRAEEACLAQLSAVRHERLQATEHFLGDQLIRLAPEPRALVHLQADALQAGQALGRLGAHLRAERRQLQTLHLKVAATLAQDKLIDQICYSSLHCFSHTYGHFILNPV